MKAFWASKTLWANVVIPALVVYLKLTPEQGAAILAVVNIVLRLVTKQPVGLSNRGHL